MDPDKSAKTFSNWPLALKSILFSLNLRGIVTWMGMFATFIVVAIVCEHCGLGYYARMAVSLFSALLVPMIFTLMSWFITKSGE